MLTCSFYADVELLEPVSGNCFDGGVARAACRLAGIDTRGNGKRPIDRYPGASACFGGGREIPALF